MKGGGVTVGAPVGEIVGDLVGVDVGIQCAQLIENTSHWNMSLQPDVQ